MKEKENTIKLNIRRTLFVYDNEYKINFIHSSNIPHINVEDNRNWKSHKTEDNPNLIGQIHSYNNDEVFFYLCFNPQDKKLSKNDLKAIIDGIEYVENFIKQKNR